MDQSHLPSRRHLGDLPVIVLSAGRPEGVPPEFLESQRAEHARLAKLSTRGELRILPESGHQFHFDAPEGILEAVRDVLGSADARREVQ